MEVTIERLGRKGDGIARDIRVPFGLPGERWRLDGNEEATLLVASAERVPPACRHFGDCGGCQVQHASDGFLGTWKVETIVRALEAQGVAAPLRPMLTSPPRSRRRAVFAGRRTRKQAIVGFHGRRSEALVDVIECHVVRPEILAAKPALVWLTTLAASRLGVLRLAVTSGPAGIDVAVSGGRDLDGALRETLAGLAEAVDLARLSWGGETVALRRSPFQLMGSVRVVPPPGAFLQATEEGEAALVEAVREVAAGAVRVADLFAGCGTFALPLAETATVAALEGDVEMVGALVDGWRRATGLRRVSAVKRDLFRRPLLAEELKGVEVVVIDPPRSGAEAQCRELARSDVARIAAVSCDPASFARDVRLLVEGGFRLDWVQPVDQFRWSGHVELAACLSR